MAGRRYIKRKNEIARQRGLKGVEARRRLMIERAEPMKVVGRIETFGVLGEHTIELLDGGDERKVWIRVDGEIRCPRTLEGVVRVLAGWIWNKRKVKNELVKN